MKPKCDLTWNKSKTEPARQQHNAVMQVVQETPASPCANQRCSCNASDLSCTAYCKCSANNISANKHTQSMTLVEAHDDTSNDEYDNDDDDDN